MLEFKTLSMNYMEKKIDVIEWNEDPAIYIAAALLPAQVMAVDANDEEKICTSYST